MNNLSVLVSVHSASPSFSLHWPERQQPVHAEGGLAASYIYSLHVAGLTRAARRVEKLERKGIME
jgi:hypothetical protein